MIPVVTNCELCPALCKARTKIINGTGNEEPRIVFVGDIPLEDDDVSGRPFMGKAGNILYELCQLAGINMEYVYLTNACRCRAPKGRNPAPTSDEVKACRAHLLEEIKALNPKVVVTLGGPALASLVGGPTAITKVMGQIMYTDDLPGIPFIPTYHPRYLLAKRWDQVPLIVAHLKKANRAVDGINQEMGEYHTVKTVKELEMLTELLTDPTQTPILSFDTETTGLSWMEAELLCIAFSGRAGEGWTVPLLHREAWEEVTTAPLKPTRAVTLLAGRTMKGVWSPLKQISPAEEEWIETWQAFVPYWRTEKGKLELPPEIFFLEERQEHSRLEPFWSDEDWERVIELIQQIFGSAIPKAGQNVGFDINMLERSPDDKAVGDISTAFGFKIANVTHDSKTVSGLLHETLPKNLTVLTAFHTDMPFYEASVSSFKSHMQDCPNDDVWVYGAADADVVSRVLGQLLPELEAEGTQWLYERICIPLIRCATKLERRGIMIDQVFFDKLCKYYTFQIEQANAHLTKVLGRELKSPTYWQTLQDLLWGEFKLPLPPGRGFKIKSAKNCDKCTDDTVCSAAHASTSGETLSWLMERSDNEALPILQGLKTLEKFKGTYLDGGKGGFKRHIKKDSRIHPRWSPGAAETGRFTCEKPNAMNPPKGTKIFDDDFDIHSNDAIREMMVAPKGKVHMNADWSQLEVWVLAYETGDKTLLNLLQGGEDVHCVTPNTPILTRDLHWVSAGTLQKGDALLAFQEYPTTTRKHRRFQDAYVTYAERIRAPLYELTLSNGEILRSTGEHKWLAWAAGEENRRWIRTDEMHRALHVTRTKKYILPRAILPWDELPSSEEKGYLAAAFDGEGGLRMRDKISRSFNLTFTQRDNPMLVRVRDLLKHFGFDFNDHIRLDGCHQLTVRGGWSEILRFLGQIRPPYLLKRWQEADISQSSVRSNYHVEVVSVEFVGEGEITQLSSSSQTYLAAGYCAHNTFVARELCKLNISNQFQAKDADDPNVDNVMWRALHEDLRGRAKTFTFGLSYGLTEEGAATRLGCTVEQARMLIDAFLTIFPGLRDYFARIREQLLRYHMIPNKFNRFRHFPEVPVLMSLGYHWEIENMIREAVNYPIQSGGHDLHSLAHIMHENTPALVERAAPILELHDSLLMEAVDLGDPEYLIKTAWMVKSSWEKVARDTVIWNGSKLGWECLVEVEWGRSFGAPEWKLDVRGKVAPIAKEKAS